MTIVGTAEAARPARPPRRPLEARPPRGRLRLRNTLTGLSFILPNFIGFAVLTLVPVGTLFYMSFTNRTIFGQADWVGTENFRRLINDKSFHKAVVNTLYYAALHVPMTIVVALALALLLNNKLRGVAFFRTAAFFPYITSIVAIAMVWNIMFSPDSGPINQGLRLLGIDEPPGWLTSPTWAMPAVAIVSTWRDMGYYMILFLAGLQTVPRELYESARIDGANGWQRFAHVTLPGLRPTMFFITVILTINSFKVFDLILVMTNGGPGLATTVLSQFIYRKGFVESQFGYASSASVALFLLCIGATIVLFFVNKRRNR
jgi:multiple sugar transport system permease protein